MINQDKFIVVRALNYAFEKHKNQKRRGSKLNYMVHPVTIMELVRQYKGDSKNLIPLQIAAILHDVVEDTNGTIEEIEAMFGHLVASLVWGLTSNQTLINEMGKNEYMKMKLLEFTQYEFTLKCLDRLGNILDGPHLQYVLDTIELVNYLKENREEITSTQQVILDDLLEACVAEKQLLEES